MAKKEKATKGSGKKKEKKPPKVKKPKKEKKEKKTTTKKVKMVLDKDDAFEVDYDSYDEELASDVGFCFN